MCAHTRAADCPAASPRRSTSSSSTLGSYAFYSLAAVGVLARAIFVYIPGNAQQTPWSGGGDTPDYILLARNLIAHFGYSYGGQPSAYRPPMYPLILASFMKTFGNDYILAVRWLQFCEGLLVAFLCAAIARKVFGSQQAKLSFLVAMFLPTLVEMSAEVLTEATATVAVCIFLYFLVRYGIDGDWRSLVWMSAAIGLGSLVRSNLSFLGVVSVGCVLVKKSGGSRWRDVVLAVLIPCVVISPWVARNLKVFHGSVVFSTQAGFDALAGVLSPQGRAQTDEMARIHSAVGLPMSGGLETNDPIRSQLPSEPEIDRRCWKAAFRAWKQAGWGLIPITVKKVGYFWLSTDQLLWTGDFSPAQRAARAIGVLAYWLVLFFGLLGWFRLRAENPALAKFFLIFAVIVTLLHIPFNMNTRYRMTFMDPLLAILAGEGLLILIRRFAGGLAARLSPKGVMA
jgi:hypothetical protein